MKHLNNYKIFESDTYKDPIDVESDVNEFLEKLGEKFKASMMLRRLVKPNTRQKFKVLKDK